MAQHGCSSVVIRWKLIEAYEMCENESIRKKKRVPMKTVCIRYIFEEKGEVAIHDASISTNQNGTIISLLQTLD